MKCKDGMQNLNNEIVKSAFRAEMGRIERKIMLLAENAPEISWYRLVQIRDEVDVIMHKGALALPELEKYFEALQMDTYKGNCGNVCPICGGYLQRKSKFAYKCADCEKIVQW
jgi:hypothetical protein